MASVKARESAANAVCRVRPPWAYPEWSQAMRSSPRPLPSPARQGRPRTAHWRCIGPGVRRARRSGDRPFDQRTLKCQVRSTGTQRSRRESVRHRATSDRQGPRGDRTRTPTRVSGSNLALRRLPTAFAFWTWSQALNLAPRILFYIIAIMKSLDAIAALSALASAARLAVFRMLVKRGPEGYTPSELTKRLDLPAPTLSFHLRGLDSGRTRGQPPRESQPLL